MPDENGNGLLKKIKTIVYIVGVLVALSGSVWTYVEKRIAAEVAYSEIDLKLHYDKQIKRINGKITLLNRLIVLRNSERRLEKMLLDKCPDKTELKNEYDDVKKRIIHIERKLSHQHNSKK